MSKFNVGDKVRIKGDLSKCEFGCNCYMEWFVGKEAIVTSTFGKGIIKLDIDAQAWDWSENVLELIKENDNMNTKIEEGNKVNESDLKDSEIYEKVEEKKEVENDNVKMKRIDYILNAKDNIQAILDETVLDCDICPASCENCNGNCEFHYKKYLNEEIEVNESDLKDVGVKEELDTKENIVNDTVNPFMEEYEKIVMDTMELCKRKNKDYGNATDESFKQFGDVSYLVRCFDKWSRINTLLKNRKAEVSESLEDSLLDLSNYLFLWVTSRRLKENN